MNKYFFNDDELIYLLNKEGLISEDNIDKILINIKFNGSCSLVFNKKTYNIFCYNGLYYLEDNFALDLIENYRLGVKLKSELINNNIKERKIKL